MLVKNTDQLLTNVAQNSHDRGGGLPIQDLWPNFGIGHISIQSSYVAWNFCEMFFHIMSLVKKLVGSVFTNKK